MDGSGDVDGSLEITRDGGLQWSRLPLPANALQGASVSVSEGVWYCRSGLAAVAVLPNETIAVVVPPPERGRRGGFFGRTPDVDVDTLASGASAWTVRGLEVKGQTNESLRSLRIISSEGALKGLWINGATGPLGSGGTWVSTTDGGESWQDHQEAPTAGVMSDAHGLWLVGAPPLRHTVYYSANDGDSWEEVKLPVTLAGSQHPANSWERPSFGDFYPHGEGVATTATNETETQLLLGTPSGSGWQWTQGPTLILGTHYGNGVPANTAEAAGVLWNVGAGAGETRVARVNMASGQVSTVTAHGLPANGSKELYPTGPEAAWASDETASCRQGKTECTQTIGLLATADGGENWHALGPSETRPW